MTSLETPDSAVFFLMWFYGIIRLFALFNQALNLIRLKLQTLAFG